MVRWAIAGVVLMLGFLYRRQVLVRSRQDRTELIEALVDMPVYLTSDLWQRALQAGLVSSEEMAAIRRMQAERRARERAQEGPA